jgi:Tol biopolymer transport system component
MMKNRSLQILLFSLLALIGIAGGLFLFLWVNRTPEPVLLTSEIGVNGPVRISLSREIDTTLLETSLTFHPEITTRMVWDGQNLFIWPEQLLEAGETIDIFLDMGQLTTGDDPFSEQSYSWSVTVRAPQLVYLSDPVNNPEISISSLDGVTREITSSGGQVIDYSASFSGGEIACSVANINGGSDIWMWSRSSDTNQLVYACGENDCIHPVVSPDGDTIVFIQPDNTGNGVLWQVDTQTNEAEIIQAASSISAAQPEWSPNGQYISFYNTRENSIQIIDMTTNDVFTIPASQADPGSWLPDSEHLAFSEQLISNNLVYTQVYILDLSSGTVEPILGENPQTLEYGVPEWSPDGEWLVISQRTMLQSGNNQLWIMHPDGSQAQAIADDPMYYYGSYHWSPDGSAIIYQQFNTTRSDSVPQVMVWDRGTGESWSVISNAALPQWLP